LGIFVVGGEGCAAILSTNHTKSKRAAILKMIEEKPYVIMNFVTNCGSDCTGKDIRVSGKSWRLCSGQVPETQLLINRIIIF
jgi:hypothetical protein